MTADPASDMREILRVVKPRGLGGRHLSAGDHADLLSAAGYSDVATFVEPDKGWTCAVAKKASTGVA
jgi:hypothetical protein